MRVAFLGLGRMGVAMSRHVLTAGHELVVWNRTPGKAGDLVEAGATEAKTPAEAAQDADAVVLMLFGPDSVREVLPQVVRKGLLVIDSTTIGPDAAREFGRLCSDAGARYVDAPVAGSVGPATDGTLGVLAGAHEDDWPAAEPLLQLWADPARVRRVGAVGAGSALKLVVNQGIGVLAAGLGEALRLGTELGLDRTLVLDVLSQGAYGWTLNQKRSMFDASDYSGTQFSLDLLAKDLGLAVDAARDAELEVTRAVLQACRTALDAGHSGEDYAAVVGHLADEGAPNSH
ncbi:MAG: NAD(P)-dependent oxidoreductase [Actinobacteria bacterium]|nr:NAD(P)-dependent oxidoreductase [Actinomycetota bacterium]